MTEFDTGGCNPGGNPNTVEFELEDLLPLAAKAAGIEEGDGK